MIYEGAGLIMNLQRLKGGVNLMPAKWRGGGAKRTAKL